MRSSGGIFVCLLLLCICAQAQHIQYSIVKGTVIDSSGRQPLEAATVSAYLLSDSSLINYALTSRRGEFTIKEIPVGKPCWLMISYNGFKSTTKNFIIPADDKELILGPIGLLKSFSQLDEIMVIGQRPPVLIKQDTIEFNASSVKTPPNAVVEDVLKQLPGVEIDKDGNIIINGKKVSKIMVDGKDFFGGDPKIALKNLPRDIIDKIQVTENKSKEAQFNKTSSGNEDLAINLTLKREIKRGMFGRASAGYGTDNRYEAAANLNLFDKDNQISFIGNANNTNRSGFSGGDFNISSGRSSLGGGGGGITNSKAGGINFSNNIGKQLKVNGSYFYNSSDISNSSHLQRQNILPDTTFFYNAANNNSNRYDNHRVSLNIDYMIDSMTELHANTSYNTSNGHNISATQAVSAGTSGKKINESANTYSANTAGHSASAELFFSHRFKKKGRSVTLGYNYSDNYQASTDHNIGENIFYKNDTVDSRDSVNQQIKSRNTGNNVSLSATWSEPVSSSFTLLLRHNYRKSINNSSKDAQNYNPYTGKYDKTDTAFSNSFRSTVEEQTPGINLVYFKKELRVSIGSAIQFLTQDNISLTDKSSLNQYFINFTPSASVGYNFSKTSNINIYYNGRSQQPSILQLQPVPDNSNPLYIRLGNPDLQPSFYHNINLQARQTNGTTFWFGGFGFNTVSKQIIYETFFDDVGRQVSKPLNVNGNYGFSGNINFSKSWKKRNSLFRISLGSNGNFNRNMTFTNSFKNISKGYTLSQSLGFGYTFKQLLTVIPAFFIRYNNTKYSVVSLPNSEYISRGFSMSFFWNYPKRLVVENDFQYNYNSQTAPGFRKGVTMWSSAVNWQLFKKHQGTLRVAVYDILRQNAGVYRSITQTYIEDRQTDVLQRYILFSFIYTLQKVGK